MPVHVLQHPLGGHYLTRLRDLETPPDEFRRLSKALSMLLILRATGAMRTRALTVRTPNQTCEGTALAEPLAVVPVLRAGLGMLEPALELFPDVAVGYVGLERHEQTAVARSYYSKLPALEGRFTLCLDPMLATGGSASQAINLIRAHGGRRVAMVCVVAAPQGIQKMERDHPDVDIFTAAVDEGLNDRAFIVPGLGDYGDRLYGTF